MKVRSRRLRDTCDPLEVLGSLKSPTKVKALLSERLISVNSRSRHTILRLELLVISLSISTLEPCGIIAGCIGNLYIQFEYYDSKEMRPGCMYI